MKSYKQKFLENLDIEIEEFRTTVLKFTPKEIYEDANRINFYEFMNEYLRSKEFNIKEYKMFLESDHNLLYNLRDIYHDQGVYSEATNASCIVNSYFADCIGHLIRHCM